ncbi:ATP-binding protein [Pseudomonas syringae]|uniref:ATP-binding protein n=1 Tax=Pseudomonas syringae TaxID=317 RepID=UPI001BCBE38E|nr:ATP-binding protein [Pseudomonas syringae]MBS7459221.1 ATP-binding protein [Pseudomonas syringae]
MNQFCLLSYRNIEGLIPTFDERVLGGNINTTVIIGPNGSGKSRILSSIIDEFCFLNYIRSGGDRHGKKLRITPGSVEIRYRLDGKDCLINRAGSNLECFVDDEWVDITEIPFPRRVAAVSHLPTDRFRFANRDDSSFYRYLGLRQSTNLTTTKALETKVLQSLLLGYEQSEFISKFESWLSLAGFTSDVVISMELASPSLLSEDFGEFKEAMFSADARRSSVKDRYSPSYIESSIDKIWSLFSLIRGLNWSLERRPSCAYKFSYLLGDPRNARIWLEGFDLARRWRLFHSVDLVMSKSGGRFPFSELSSGEQQLIGTSARLLSELDSESLIIIDEPEVSLHPEWQIKYIPTLRECLSTMSAMHVIIATHSHFMVSDLDAEASALVTTGVGGSERASLFDGAVYGRSPENILYRVFGVATAGNAAVENDLYQALGMISNRQDPDVKELALIYSRLDKVRGKDNAAMNVILDQVKMFLKASQ